MIMLYCVLLHFFVLLNGVVSFLDYILLHYTDNVKVNYTYNVKSFSGRRGEHKDREASSPPLLFIERWQRHQFATRLCIYQIRHIRIEPLNRLAFTCKIRMYKDS